MSGGTASEPLPKGTWWMVVAMATCQALVLFDLTAFGVALPTLRAALDLSPGEASWAVNAYVLAYAACVALGGRLSDRYSHLKTFIAGMAIFISASVACGMTPGTGSAAATWLVAARTVQGVGGALMMPAALAVVVAAVPAATRGRAMAVFIGGGQTFFIMGPILGGAITQALSWRWIFFIAVPLAALALVLIQIARTVGRNGAPSAPKDSDAATARGGILRWTALPLMLGIAILVLGLERADNWGWGSPLTLGAVAVSICLLALVVHLELRAPDPLIELHLLAGRSVSRYVATQFLLQILAVGILTFAPIYFQRYLALSPATTGLVMFAFVGGWVAMVPISGYLVDRFGPIKIMAIGSVMLVCGLAWWTLHLGATGPSALWLQMPAMLATGIGVGLNFLPAYSASIAAARPSRVAASIGLVQTIRQGGGAISVAALSVFFFHAHGPGSPSPAASVADYRTGFFILLAAAALAASLSFAAFLNHWRSPAPAD